jgi:hypothetical protein
MDKEVERRKGAVRYRQRRRMRRRRMRRGRELVYTVAQKTIPMF